MKKLIILAVLAIGLSSCTEEKDCWTCRVSAFNYDIEMMHNVIQHYDCGFDAQQWGDRTWSNGKAERISCHNNQTGETIVWED